jgi:hypothetical protein
MSSTSSRELAASHSASKEPGCEPSRSVRSSRSAIASSRGTGRKSLSTATSTSSQPTAWQQTEFELMSSAADSRAKGYQRQDFVRDCKTRAAAYGENTPVLLAKFDRATSSWRTFQNSFVTDTGWERFSETWPKSGMTRNGIAFQLSPLVPTTFENVSGSLPTPTAQGFSRFTSSGGSNARKKWAKMLPKMMPTITARDHRGGCLPERSERMRETSARGLDLPSVLRLLFPDSTGLVRPSWGEVRMGYPIGWTECTPSEIPSSPKSRKSSAARSSRTKPVAQTD